MPQIYQSMVSSLSLGWNYTFRNVPQTTHSGTLTKLTIIWEFSAAGTMKGVYSSVPAALCNRQDPLLALPVPGIAFR
jgi:hypothetical protein